MPLPRSSFTPTVSLTGSAAEGYSRVAEEDEGLEISFGFDQTDSFSMRPASSPRVPLKDVQDPLTVVSDFDDTALPQKAPRYQFAGMSQLFEEVDQALGGTPGQLHFVTARPKLIASSLPMRLAEKGFGEVQIHHGRLMSILTMGLLDGIQDGKMKNLEKLAERYPETRFVLFGDTVQRDPEAYREFMNKYPDRVAAVIIRAVDGHNNSPSRLAGFHQAQTAVEGALHLQQLGLLDSEAIERIAKAQHMDLSRI